MVVYAFVTFSTPPHGKAMVVSLLTKKYYFFCRYTMRYRALVSQLLCLASKRLDTLTHLSEEIGLGAVVSKLSHYK